MNCKEGSLIIIKQIHDLLDKLSDAQYSAPLELFSGSTVGKHIRHIFDFYNSVVCIENGHLDYSKRNRDPQIEKDTSYTSLAFESLQKKITQLSTDLPIRVMTDFDIAHDDCQACVQSSIGRELMYAYDHAVHHLAIVKMGVNTHLPEIQMDKNIGVASSTIHYHDHH